MDHLRRWRPSCCPARRRSPPPTLEPSLPTTAIQSPPARPTPTPTTDPDPISEPIADRPCAGGRLLVGDRKGSHVPNSTPRWRGRTPAYRRVLVAGALAGADRIDARGDPCGGQRGPQDARAAPGERGDAGRACPRCRWRRPVRERPPTGRCRLAAARAGGVRHATRRRSTLRRRGPWSPAAT